MQHCVAILAKAQLTSTRRPGIVSQAPFAHASRPLQARLAAQASTASRNSTPVPGSLASTTGVWHSVHAAALAARLEPPSQSSSAFAHPFSASQSLFRTSMPPSQQHAHAVDILGLYYIYHLSSRKSHMYHEACSHPGPGYPGPQPDRKSLVPMPSDRRSTPRWPRCGDGFRAVGAERGGHGRVRHDRQPM